MKYIFYLIIFLVVFFVFLWAAKQPASEFQLVCRTNGSVTYASQVDKFHPYERSRADYWVVSEGNYYPRGGEVCNTVRITKEQK